MDRSGFTELDTLPLKAASKKIYLFQVPQNYSLQNLDGLQINLVDLMSTQNAKSNDAEYNICYSKLSTSDSIRPILSNSLVGGITLGPQVSGLVSVTKKYINTKRNAETKVNKLFYIL
jgi:hypothetical protein